jgi:hypothetical protein
MVSALFFQGSTATDSSSVVTRCVGGTDVLRDVDRAGLTRWYVQVLGSWVTGTEVDDCTVSVVWTIKERKPLKDRSVTEESRSTFTSVSRRRPGWLSPCRVLRPQSAQTATVRAIETWTTTGIDAGTPALARSRQSRSETIVVAVNVHARIDAGERAERARGDGHLRPAPIAVVPALVLARDRRRRGGEDDGLARLLPRRRRRHRNRRTTTTRDGGREGERGTRETRRRRSARNGVVQRSASASGKRRRRYVERHPLSSISSYRG